MPNIGPLELVIVLVIVLLLFGAKRLPELGRSLGSGMKEFKDSVSTGKDDDEADKDALGRKQIDRASVQDAGVGAASPEADAASQPGARTEPTVKTEPRP